MKELLIVLFTIDMNCPPTRRCIKFLKETNLSRAELLIFDTGYNPEFNEPAVMNSLLEFAKGHPVIFLKNNVLIEDKEWILKLQNTAEKADAEMVVSCSELEVIHQEAEGALKSFGSGEDLSKDIEYFKNK